MQFDAAEIDQLGYYVYVYSDPRNGAPFYVGKGRGNRVFSHLREAGGAGEHEKLIRIREIEAASMSPRLEILAFGLDEETAFKVEAAAIDLIGFENLTNRVLGHGAREWGRMSIDTVHAKLAATPLDRVEEPVVMIRISSSVAAAESRLATRFDDDSPAAAVALYDATRGAWRIDPQRIERDGARHVLAVYQGVVREVYEVAAWLQAGSTMYTDAVDRRSDRWEFVGRIAELEVRRRYRLRSVAHAFPPGAQNPVRYVGVGPIAG